MSSDVAKGATFVCPDCGGRLSASGELQDALVEHGCVLCGAAVTEGTDTGNSDGK